MPWLSHKFTILLFFMAGLSFQAANKNGKMSWKSYG
jgi:hypothetical protein